MPSPCSGSIAGIGSERSTKIGDRQGDRDQPGADQVGEMEAGVERRRVGGAAVEQRARALGRQRGEDREADRAADLGAGVDDARGQAGVFGVAPDIASVISEGKEIPMPTPISSIGGSRSAR